MAHGGEHIALFVEQLERSRIWNIENRLYRDFAAHNSVIGAVNQAHAALAEDLPDLVASRQFSWGRRTVHSAPRFRGLSILIDFGEKYSRPTASLMRAANFAR